MLLRLKQKDAALNSNVNLSIQWRSGPHSYLPLFASSLNILKISVNVPAVCITHCPFVSSPLLSDFPGVAGYFV